MEPFVVRASKKIVISTIVIHLSTMVILSTIVMLSTVVILSTNRNVH